VRVLRVLPGEPESAPTDPSELAGWLDQLYRVPQSAGPESTWVRINLIASVNGSAVGVDGTSETLTGGIDRRILGAIRRNSDVVLVGAGTVRIETYLLPKTAALAVVTRTGDLSGNGFDKDADAGRGKLYVICPPEAAAKVRETAPNAELIEVDRDELNPKTFVSLLTSRGMTRIVCEGGPSLADEMLRGNVVNELCISAAPYLDIPGVPTFGGEELHRSLAINQLIVDETGRTYARWLVEAVV
jgi:riboflavin biosynthesis pyrimidine reductase